MESILKIFNELLDIIRNNEGSKIINDDLKIRFKGLLNDFLGDCSESLEIPDFLSALTYLTSRIIGGNIIHKDTGDKYKFGSFCTRTSKNNKGTDILYFKEITYSNNCYFTKTLKDFCVSFEDDNYLRLEMFNTALKAERICYSGKGFTRDDNKKSFMLFLADNTGKKCV